MAWKKEVLTIPCGKCTATSEKGRLIQAHREPQEEIGFDTKRVEKLISYYVSSRIKLEPHVYLARDLFISPKPPAKHEFLEIVKLPFAKAFDLYTSGKEKTNSYTLIVFLLAKMYFSQSSVKDY